MKIRTVGNLNKKYWRFIVSYVETLDGQPTRYERGFKDQTSASQEFGWLRNQGKNAGMRAVPGREKQ